MLINTNEAISKIWFELKSKFGIITDDVPSCNVGKADSNEVNGPNRPSLLHQ